MLSWNIITSDDYNCCGNAPKIHNHTRTYFIHPPMYHNHNPALLSCFITSSWCFYTYVLALHFLFQLEDSNTISTLLHTTGLTLLVPKSSSGLEGK